MNAPRKLRLAQRGLSMIELMVAMAIGLFLLLGVTQIFVSNQKNYLFQQSQAGNQENGRFTLAILEQELTKAGYRSVPSDPLTTVFPAATSLGCNFTTGNAVASVTNGLCVRYEARNAADVDCQGAPVSGTIVNYYQSNHPIIVEKFLLDTTNQALTCISSNAGSTTQQVTTGVADIRFEYGLPTTSGAGTSISYSSTSGATTGSVRYAVLLQSTGTALLNDSNSSVTNPVLLDWQSRYSGTVGTSNTQIYQIVQSTIMLRNLMP